MTQIMEAVVDRGTATAAKINGYTIAGKTGTSAKIVNGRYSKSEYNTSFVGFIPSRKPALTIIVVIDSPHGRVTAYGGTVAAPVFQRIADAALRHMGIGPTINPAPPVMIARRENGAEPAQPVPVGASQVADRVRATVPEGSMPDLRGLGAREAVKSLMRIGLNARVSGDGFVIEQSPEPGAPLVRGDDALLKLARRMPALAAGGTQQ